MMRNSENMKMRKWLLLVMMPVWIGFYGCMTVIGIFYDLPDEQIYPLTFDETTRHTEYRFIFPDTAQDAYLRELRLTYHIDSITMGASNSLEKIIRILHWTHTRFSHSGWQSAQKKDALSILKEAENGKNFRCVEYGIVCAAALNSIGIPARSLGLQTRDVETVEFAAGHVATEAYLPELKKWVFLDPQCDIIPMLDGVPLNAVEFQKAIINNKPVKLVNQKGEVRQERAHTYIRFVAKYLYYFVADFDQRNISAEENYSVGGLKSLQLGPVSAKQPVLFQRQPTQKKAYTHALLDFYSEPVIQ